MATRGRKPKPGHLKVLAGTDRPDRDKGGEAPAFDLVEEFPEPPQHLNTDGAEMWRDLGPRLVAASVLQVVDLYALEQLCATWQQQRQRAKAGLPSKAADLNALRCMFNEFGMTPASRARVPGSAPPNGNKFSANGRRSEP
ncbi:hypothetical protein [Alloalcanivorax marinus]|uniref:hypothetical protein n=1 Tax=Alloalcanivorax marinus TaxID=1177169 RepID=UPI0021CE4F5B|nr:hypothetical protein [Alloalcanivorax marinus]MCU5785932.1 hypothetical protein [Alloalcanivorax marinus]